MTVKLHQPIAGKDAGATYSGPMESWLLALGYASVDGDTTDKVDVTGVADIGQDPTLPENREEPGAPFKISGEKAKPRNNAAETKPAQERTPRRGRIVGANPEDSAVPAELDGRVEPEKVEGKPEVQEDAEKAADETAGTGDVHADEPEQETPASTEGETPADTEDETPADTEGETPADTEDETPADTEGETPASK
jgi:hypothetical protein